MAKIGILIEIIMFGRCHNFVVVIVVVVLVLVLVLVTNFCCYRQCGTGGGSVQRTDALLKCILLRLNSIVQ